MNSELHNYFKNFLSDTLGVQSILSDNANKSSTGQVINEKYVIAVESLKSYNSAESELLNKMIAALKIQDSDLCLLDETELHNVTLGQDSIFIQLKDRPSVTNKNNETYSARTLLLQPEFKRKAWDDLKYFLTKG